MIIYTKLYKVVKLSAKVIRYIVDVLIKYLKEGYFSNFLHTWTNKHKTHGPIVKRTFVLVAMHVNQVARPLTST